MHYMPKKLIGKRFELKNYNKSNICMSNVLNVVCPVINLLITPLNKVAITNCVIYIHTYITHFERALWKLYRIFHYNYLLDNLLGRDEICGRMLYLLEKLYIFSKSVPPHKLSPSGIYIMSLFWRRFSTFVNILSHLRNFVVAVVSKKFVSV